jgi:endo-beta-N-acetylglucosaminidase D
MNAVGAANEQQHADWNATQVDHARNTQGVSNYLLDQSVIEVNNGYGTVGHGTVWNRTAEALVKSDPNHFSYVDVPDYWAGTDFRP